MAPPIQLSVVGVEECGGEVVGKLGNVEAPNQLSDSACDGGGEEELARDGLGVEAAEVDLGLVVGGEEGEGAAR